MTSGNEVEIYFALGTQPVLIGAGSLEDVARISREADAIDAVSVTPPGAITSAATRHFYRELGRVGGVEETTVQALSLYEDTVTAGRKAFLQNLIASAEQPDDM